MKTKGRSPRQLRTRQFRLSMFATMIILFTIPLAVYSILQDSSFDPTSRANEPTGPVTCTINFPYVSPLSIANDSTVQLRLITEEVPNENLAKTAEITSVNVISDMQGELFSNQYPTGDQAGNEVRYLEAFTYTADAEGIDKLTGTVTAKNITGEESTHDCQVVTPLAQNRMTVLATNMAPSFTNSPKNTDNVLEKGDSYTYTLKASDPEGDKISYHASFTPRAEWLKITEVKDGTNGDLEIKFQGVASEPASYLANVFIHDGYNAHLSSQSWVISVEQGENDIPKVTVTDPESDISVTKGAEVEIEWEVDDLNQILWHKIYRTTNPGDETSWFKLDALSHKYGAYMFDTTGLADDNYYIIIEAVDNQDPAGIGHGISKRIAVGNAPDDNNNNDDNDPDDGPVLTIPQISDISPEDGSELKNPRPTVSATLIAGRGATVNTTSIKFDFDGADMSSSVELARQSDSEYRLIYTPDEDLEGGSHKVKITFKDSDGDSAEKEWSFTIEQTDSDVISIFGFEIPKRTAIIIGAGLLILIAALAVPWLLYLAWKGNDDSDYNVYTSATPTSPSYTDYNSSTYDTSTPSTVPEATYANTTNNATYTPTYDNTPESSIDTNNFSTAVGAAPTDTTYTPAETTYDTSNTYTPTPADTVSTEVSYDSLATNTTPDVSSVDADATVYYPTEVVPADDSVEVVKEDTTPVIAAASPDIDTNPPVKDKQAEELAQIAEALQNQKDEPEPYDFLTDEQKKSS